MSRDNIDDFIEFLKAENKFYVIAIFDSEIEGMNVLDNLEEIPNVNIDFTYSNGKVRSKVDTVLDGIKFCIKD